jgi:DNA-binding NarL/FixJ family response regulator
MRSGTIEPRSKEQHKGNRQSFSLSGAPKSAKLQALIIVVDSRELLRTAISSLLNHAFPRASVLGLSRPAELALVAEGLKPQIDLVALGVPSHRGRTRPLREEVADLKRSLQHKPVVLFGDHIESDELAELMCMGVQGFIPLSYRTELMVETFRLIYAGGSLIPRSFAEVQPKQVNDEPKPKPFPVRGAFDSLTPRQVQVLNLLRAGKSNKIIARELEMHDSTVKVHVRQILKRMNASNRTQAAVMANAAVTGKGPALS